MYILKSFLKIDSLTNNQINTVSPIGELSDIANTYAKEKGSYTDIVNYPGFEYTTFTSLSDDSGVPVKVLMEPRTKVFLFKLAQWMYNTAAIMPQWFNMSGGTNEFLTQLQTAVENGTSPFTDDVANPLPGSVTSYDDVEILGCSEEYSVVDINGDDRYFVHWVQFQIDYAYDTGSGIESRTADVKIWLNDEDFRLTYDDFELVVVPMVSDLDDFFDTYTNVLNMVTAAKEPTNIVTRLNAAKGDNPCTIEKVLTYNWHDDELPPNTIPVPWGVVIYGAAGDNLDAIREALREYILDHSSHPEEDGDPDGHEGWGDIFPGIFRVSEFMLIPMWHRYAIPNATLTQGIYSPVVSLFRDKTILNQVCPNMSLAYISEHAESFVFQYKSIAIYSIPSEFNNVDLFKLQASVPDFASIPTSSLDFSRLNLMAQEWLEKIANAIIAAESMTNISALPIGMARVHRNGVMFVATEINEKTYLIAAKKFFNDNIPEIIASEE